MFYYCRHLIIMSEEWQPLPSNKEESRVAAIYSVMPEQPLTTKELLGTKQ